MLALAVFALWFALSGCRSSKKASKVDVIHIGALQGPTGLGIVGMLEKVPAIGAVELRYSLSSSPDLVVSKVLSGELDLANLPTNVAAKLYNDGIPIKLAGINTWGVLYLLVRSRSVVQWQDLKGGKVYLMGRGATPDILLRYLLTRNGLKPEVDVALDFTFGQIELAQQMIAGNIDVVLMPEPYVTKVLRSCPDVTIALDLQEEWRRAAEEHVPMPMGCLVVRAELARSRPDLVAGLLREYEGSIDWVNGNPREAARLIEKYKLLLDAEEAEQAIPRCNNRYLSAPAARNAVEAYLEVFLEYAPKSLGGKLPDDEFYFEG